MEHNNMRATARYIVQIFLRDILYLNIILGRAFNSTFCSSVKVNVNEPSAEILSSNGSVEYCINPTDRAITFHAIRSSLVDSVQ